MEMVEIVVSEQGSGKIWGDDGKPARAGDLVAVRNEVAKMWASAGWIEFDLGARRKGAGK